MKKIIAFASSLLLVIPAFGQNTATKDSKTPVSKVKPADVKPTPAPTNAKSASNDHKSPGHVEKKSKKSSGGTTTQAPK